MTCFVPRVNTYFNKTCSNTKNLQYRLPCLQRSTPDGFVSHNLASLVLTTKTAKALPPKSGDDGYYPITVLTEPKYMASMWVLLSSCPADASLQRLFWVQRTDSDTEPQCQSGIALLLSEEVMHAPDLRWPVTAAADRPLNIGWACVCLFA